MGFSVLVMYNHSLKWSVVPQDPSSLDAYENFTHYVSIFHALPLFVCLNIHIEKSVKNESWVTVL